MRILLIDPPFYRFIGYYNRYFPLGLAYLAAVLRKERHEVIIYDADFTKEAVEMEFSFLEEKYPEYVAALNNLEHPIWQEAKEVISQFKPDLVCITAMTTKMGSAFRLAEISKEYNPNLLVVMGGPHPTLKPEEVLKNSEAVDLVVRGEGEKIISEIAKPKASFKNIKGISYRNKNKIIHNPPQEPIRELDSIPFPARDLLMSEKFYNPEDMGLLMASRGCPFQCTFCSSKGIWGRGTRFRSVDNIINEIEEVIRAYGTKQFSFKDDIFTLSRERIIEFCQKLKQRNININWDCNIRVGLIDKDLLYIMRKAGCNGVKIGIESGNQRILNLMKKGITIEQIEKTAKILNKAGIHWTGYFMMGLPTETKEEIKETLYLMKKIKPDYASLSVYEIFPGTELFTMGIEKGLVQCDRNLNDFYSISPKYYYNKDIHHRIDTMSDEEFKKLEAEMKEAFHRYNMGLPRLIKRARARSKIYLREPKTILRDIKKFLAWAS
jgi:radical SAM superfamily enzyme YgiQ (UPF0313 family)